MKKNSVFRSFSVVLGFIRKWTDCEDYHVTWYNNPDDSNEYVIYTAKDLLGLSKLSNSGVSFIGKKIFLGDNIQLHEADWVPIGKRRGFNGIIDGQGFCISGMHGSCSFVKRLLPEGTVCNIKFTSVSTAAALVVGENKGKVNRITATGKYCAGLVGLNYGNVFDCVNRCENVSSDHLKGSHPSNPGNLGGIAGQNVSGKIDHCYNFSVISCNRSHIGGIVGENLNGIISYCLNVGDISTSGTHGVFAGGITGNNRGQIILCKNVANIAGTRFVGGIAGYTLVQHFGYDQNVIAKSLNQGGVCGDSEVGGIAGTCDGGGNIIDCSNFGRVQAQDVAGGIVGCGTMRINYSASLAANCLNSGDVSANKCAGGIVGVNHACNIINSVNSGCVIGNEMIGILVGENKTNSDFVTSNYWKKPTSTIRRPLGQGIEFNGYPAKLSIAVGGIDDLCDALNAHELVRDEYPNKWCGQWKLGRSPDIPVQLDHSALPELIE